MYLCRVMSENEGYVLCYIMKTPKQNKDLWHRNIEYRDNGTLTIGSVFRCLAPRPVERFMKYDIPSMESNFPIVLMRDPATFLQTDTDTEIQVNQMLGFSMNNCFVTADALTPIASTCTGHFCDGQRTADSRDPDYVGCGCFYMNHRRSSVKFEFDIFVQAGLYMQFNMRRFSSNKFSSLFFTHTLSPNVMLQQLQFSEEFFEIETVVQNVTQFINDNGGFTVQGWHTRGLVNDRTLAGHFSNNNNNNHGAGNNYNENQVENANVCYYITSIIPTNVDMSNSDTELERQLRALQFNVSRFS